jgi:hypothetical protein
MPATRSMTATAAVALVIGVVLTARTARPPIGSVFGIDDVSAAEGYAAPRYPKYLRTVTSVDPLMPAARMAARQIGGRTPLGLLKSGEHVLLVVPDVQDKLVLEAVKRALEERSIKVSTVFNYQLQGLTERQAQENREALKAWRTYGDQGWKEIGTFQSRLARFLSDEQRKAITPPAPPHKANQEDVETVPGYVARHPELNRVFYGGGGRARQQRALGPNAAKFLGNWTYIRQTDLLSKIPEFPGDVWKLEEGKILDAIPFVEHVRATDPEGTDLSWPVATEEDAERWAKAAYLQGHLFLYPLQGSRGILEAAYASQVFPDANGVLAGCSNHTAYFPCIKAYIEHGQISRIEGGGKYGDLARELLANPALKNARYPTAPRPGYWYLFEMALGTNPKYFRPLRELVDGGQGAVNTPERNRSGIIHWGLGFETLDPAARKYCEANNLPCDHAWHIHNYFMTYAAKLRDEDQTVNILDKGRLTALDDAEVRALASRYGDPNLILREEWVPGIPGINLPGDYQKDYAPDPWKFIRREFDQIEKGTYRYLLDGYPTPDGLTRRSSP